MQNKPKLCHKKGKELDFYVRQFSQSCWFDAECCEPADDKVVSQKLKEKKL